MKKMPTLRCYGSKLNNWVLFSCSLDCVGEDWPALFKFSVGMDKDQEERKTWTWVTNKL